MSWKAEFQAIVMSLGKGSRMTDLTAHCPKSLLPVGNQSMIWYPLQTLQKAGFEEAIVITSESSKNKIQKEVASKLKMRLDIVEVNDEDWGTVDSLLHVADKIKSDVLVISCDLITDVDLYKFAEVHRINDATLTALFAPIPNEARLAAPGSKSKPNLELDFIALDSDTTQLLMISSEADLNDTLSIRRNILEKHSNATVYSRLMDAHLYLMKKWVLEDFARKKNFSSIKGELVPSLIEEQFKIRPKNALNKWDPQGLTSDMYHEPTSEEIRHLLMDDYGFQNVNRIRCFGCVVDDGYCLRANTISSYFEANKKAMQQTPTSSRIDSTVQKHNARVDNASFISAQTNIGEQSSVKFSVIGQNCQIGSTCQISNCVIMNNVTVGIGCILDNCIVSDEVKIGDECNLKHCLITTAVESQVKLTKELIADAQQMMEIE